MKKISKTLSAVMAAAVIFGTAAMPVSADKLKATDGIIYRYDDNSNLIGKYTGWTKNKKGDRKYYLDGYSVKGDMPVGKNIYTFDNDGIFTAKKAANIIAEQDGQIHSRDKKISVTARPADKGVYEMYPASKFERWENGKWADCLGKGVEYVTCDCLYVLDPDGVLVQDKIPEEKIDFAPEEYMGTEITAGYYRLTFPANGGNVYAIIKVTD